MQTASNWDTLIFIVNILGVTLKFALLGIFLYYTIISVFGWFRRKEVPAESFPIRHTFAIIISAHNEEKVIAGAVRSLKRLNYPSHMYDIFVVADNCKDKTAECARAEGANVYERTDTEKRGKGYSLEWMFKNLFKLEKEYDAICILDADNLVSPNFLMEMNKELSLGHNVVQGYLGSKNPGDSWISGNHSIAYWISNRLFQLPRHYLGLSCALGGTGFVMTTKVLKEFGWGATCLTEDLEFSLKLVLKGMRVSWSHDAVVYDEKPLKLSQSWRQRKRWMQGHCDCARRYFKDVFLMAIRNKDKVAFDTAMYLVQPFIIVANGLWMVVGVIQFIAYCISDFSSIFTLDNLFYALLIMVLTYYSIVFVFAEGKLSGKIMKYFLAFPLYSITWVPIIIHGFIDRDKREWVHTIHTRSLEITDMEDTNKA